MIIRTGNWFFHYRNYIFPLFYAALFIPSPGIFQNSGLALGLGFLFIAAGILVRVTTIGLVYIIRGGSGRKLYAEDLVQGGIYKVCRNPMYLGNMLLIFGFSLLANSLLYTLIFVPMFMLIYYAIIRAEEEYLGKKFGAAYQEFKSQTSSILPDLRHLKSAVQGHKFNWKKVINKEQTALFIYFSGICLVLFYQNYLEPATFIWVESFLLLAYLTGKFLKSKKLLLIMLGFISLGLTQVHAQEGHYTLKVEVENLRNSSGVLVVALYDRADVYPDEEYKYYLELIKGEIVNGASSVIFRNLPEGSYAISILHDENLDGKLKKGVVLPKEGIGFSNYLTIGRSNKPTFSKASIYLNRDLEIKIHVIYL